MVYGKIIQKDFYYFLFQKDFYLKIFLLCIVPHNYILNVLQVLWTLSLFQTSLDQSNANSEPGFPPLRQLVLGILDAIQKKKKAVACTLLLKTWRKAQLLH